MCTPLSSPFLSLFFPFSFSSPLLSLLFPFHPFFTSRSPAFLLHVILIYLPSLPNLISTSSTNHFHFSPFLPPSQLQNCPPSRPATSGEPAGQLHEKQNRSPSECGGNYSGTWHNFSKLGYYGAATRRSSY